MTAIEMQLIERLKKLPPAKVAEVVDFVEFLAVQGRAHGRRDGMIVKYQTKQLVGNFSS